MKKIIEVSIPIWFAFIAVAQAQELPAAAESRAKSLSGAQLAEAKREVSVTRDVRSAQDVDKLAQKFVQRGFLKTNVHSRGVGWKTEAHPSLPRVLLRRLPSAGQAELAPGQAMKELRASQGKVDPASLPNRAAPVIQALHDEGGFSADETFVPVHAGQTIRGYMDVASGAEEVLVSRYRLVYRRYVGGTPVMGRAGEFQIGFDADGEVETIEVPTDSYQMTGKTLPPVQASAALTRLTKNAGLGRSPKGQNETIAKNGSDVTVKDLHCGFIDDETKAVLSRGCMLRFQDRELHEQLVPID